LSSEQNFLLSFINVVVCSSILLFLRFLFSRRNAGSVAVKALCYKPERREFDTR
jgi:hypothetical protein